MNKQKLNNKEKRCYLSGYAQAIRDLDLSPKNLKTKYDEVIYLNKSLDIKVKEDEFYVY